MLQMFIQTKTVRAVIVTTEAARRVQKCEAEGLCLFCLDPIQPGERTIRKCHERCDRANRRGVAAGEWTDEGQQLAGYWGTPERTGRPSRRPAPMPTTQTDTQAASRDVAVSPE